MSADTAPVCRGCYAATLTPEQRERFYAEPVTSCIHWCDDHRRAMDEALENLPQIKMIRAVESAFPLPFARVNPPAMGQDS